MLRTCGVVLLVGVTALGLMEAADKPRPKKQTKPPDVCVIALKIERDGSNVALEGTVRNNSGRPMKGLVLFFEFIEPGGRMISRMNTEVTGTTLDPEHEGEFLAQTPDQVRAVSVRLDAEDKEGRNLTLDKPGPHVIQ